MNDRIYQKQIKLWKTLDTVYYFFYNMEEEELIDFDDKDKAQIMVEYNLRTKIVSFYITRTKEPIIEREEFITAFIEDIIEERIGVPDKIKEALIEIYNYVKGDKQWNHMNTYNKKSWHFLRIS